METSEQEQQRQAAKDTYLRKKGFGVAASPLNSVKFELGVIICVAAVLWLALDSITARLEEQLLVLVMYGVSSLCWIVFRTRRILRRQAPRSVDKPSVDKQ